VLYVRGTWADHEPRTPGSVAEGPVSQLYQPAGGHTRVRGAILLPYPREKVWAVVTDYEHYGDFLPYLTNIDVERVKDGCHMTGQAKSALRGYWDFAIDVREWGFSDPRGDLIRQARAQPAIREIAESDVWDERSEERGPEGSSS
jgi:hypothetical protein